MKLLPIPLPLVLVKHQSAPLSTMHLLWTHIIILPFGSGFFHLFICVTAYISASFLFMNNIPCMYITVCVSIHLLMDSWPIFTFQLLWTVLLWTFILLYNNYHYIYYYIYNILYIFWTSVFNSFGNISRSIY